MIVWRFAREGPNQLARLVPTETTHHPDDERLTNIAHFARGITPAVFERGGKRTLGVASEQILASGKQKVAVLVGWRPPRSARDRRRASLSLYDPPARLCRPAGRDRYAAPHAGFRLGRARRPGRQRFRPGLQPYRVMDAGEFRSRIDAPEGGGHVDLIAGAARLARKGHHDRDDQPTGDHGR